MNNKLLLGIILGVILIGMGIFLFSIKNFATYDTEERTMVIKESFLSNKIVAEISLKSDLNVYVIRGRDRLVAEFTINNIEEDFNKVFNKMEFYNIDDYNKKFDREFTYRYKKSTGFETVKDYGKVCTQEFNIINGTQEVCRREVVGTHEEETFKWVELERSEKLPTGELTIGVFTDVLPNEHIEWIPTLFDIRIDEWAEWTESLNVDLWAYYTFNDSNIDDAVGNASRDGNIIGSPAFRPGLIGDAIYFSGTSQRTEYVWMSGGPQWGAQDFTVGVWINFTTTDANEIAWSGGNGTAYTPVAGDIQGGGNPASWGMFASATGSSWALNLGADCDTAPINQWDFYVTRRLGSNFSLWKNGVCCDSGIADVTLMDSASIFLLSAGVNQNPMTGELDELGIWHGRSLSDAEIGQLYNEGAGITYIKTDVNPPSVIINSPANATYNTPINFTATVTDDLAGVDTCWGTIDGGTNNFTLINSTLNNIYNYTAPSLYADGGYLAEFYCNDTLGKINDTETISFTIDTTPPNINITYPINSSLFTYNTVDVNYTASDTIGIGSCWYSNDTMLVNHSLASCGTNITDVVWSDGQHNVTVWANDTAGNENSSSVTFIVDAVGPTISIVFPTNNSNHSNSDFDVNYTASDTIGIGSCWYSNDTMLVNHSLASCGTNITDVVWSDGQHNVTVWANDTAGNENSSSVTFIVDTTAPAVNVTAPIMVDYQLINTNLTINWTVSDLHLASCWGSFDGGVNNISLTCADLNISRNITSVNNDTFTLWANDTLGNVGETNRTWNYGVLEISQIYNAVALEKSSQTFSINMSYSSDVFNNIQAILSYNNTKYVGTKVFEGGDNIVFNRTIILPEVSIKTNFTFYWIFILTNNVNVKANSTFNNQTVNAFTIGDCYTEGIGLYNFTIVDERTQIELVGASQNTSAKIHIELYTEDRSSLVANFSQNFSKINPFAICLNNSLVGGEKYNLDAQIQYGADGYVNEFYHIQSAIIDSSTLAQNITLYALDNVTSTTFKIIYKDDNFLPLSNALIQIQRKYIVDGVFKTVEIPKTDSNGQTIAHLEEEDAIYTFIVVKDGVIRATFNDFLVKCKDPILGTCEININAFKSHLEPETFTNIDDFLFTITYNETTRTVQSIYTIPSGLTATILLNTTLYDGLGTTQVCSDSLTSASGTLSCVVPTSFENTTIVNTIYKDGEEVARGIRGVQENPSDLYGPNLMFLGFFLMITLVGVGLGSSPMISGVFLIIGAVLSIAFNLVSNTGFIGYSATILWLIIAVVIILMKGARRE